MLYNTSDLYWWARYGKFSSGMYNLPHMGEVIATYRKKRYRTQDDFAIAAGVTVRAVQEWETNMLTADMGRRIFLAKMLKITPALLGLDWHQVAYENNQSEDKDSLPQMMELIEEDAFYAYEYILIMGHEYIHNGGSPYIAYRVDRRLQKLVKLVKNARQTDKDAWLSLLCRYYQLSTRIKQQSVKDERLALEHAKKAVEIANDLQDAELIAASLVHSACTNDQQGKHVEAQRDIASAMTYVEKVNNGPLKGNIYLESANINTPFALADRTLQNQCKAWQDKATTMLYKGMSDSDESFFRFNLSAVHHEKAKTLLSWQRTAGDRKVIHEKLAMAIEALPPELAVWKGYYYMTEANLYMVSHDLEGCALSAKAALKIARAMHSHMVEDEVKSLYEQLDEKNAASPYIRNLGVELGIY